MMLKLRTFFIAIAIMIPLLVPAYAYADSITCVGGKVQNPAADAPQYCCGSGSTTVATSIDLGCEGKGNAMMDLAFAIIQLLSDGVGLVIIASLIVAGIQFTSSRGDPQSTARAIDRVQGNVTALLIFFFAYAILNYIVPGEVLK